MILKQKVDAVSEMVSVVSKPAVYKDVQVDSYVQICSSSSNYISGAAMVLSGISTEDAKKLYEIAGTGSFVCNGVNYKGHKGSSMRWSGGGFRLLKDGKSTLLRYSGSGVIGGVFDSYKNIMVAINLGNWTVDIQTT